MHQDICLGPIVPVTAVDIHLRQELRQPPGSSRIAGYKSLRGGLCFGHGRLALTKVTWHGCNHIYIYVCVNICGTSVPAHQTQQFDVMLCHVAYVFTAAH